MKVNNILTLTVSFLLRITVLNFSIYARGNFIIHKHILLGA